MGSGCDSVPSGTDNADLATFFQNLLQRRDTATRAPPARLRQPIGASEQNPACPLSRSEVHRLQQRVITPEDYDLLLRLDETVQKRNRTLSEADCERLPRPAPSQKWEDESCGVCLT